MTEETYSNSTTAKVYFYKQRKDADNIDIFIKPTTSDARVPNSLKKIFGGAGMGIFDSVVNLSGEFRFLVQLYFLELTVSFSNLGLINGTLYYNDAKELKNEYTYNVTSTKDSDNKVFCTIKGQREKITSNGTVIYYFKFVASDCFSGDDSVDILEKSFINSAYWLDDT
ncbi:hypothetical protein HYPSUDRAFT_54216 [Hypholoma sublateritium FD-334 SS-4]|uniref:Uncharacterized protein n=1 Tax=Hypholoma sublateritium (strain FD-334 SS-4) TaxID=945553 RepID=A0A0D2NYJ6_HYPSF|nr:hypothetical protein HYPSUDRAFT_54216 [Hypholoma sublateritium FD-334 SS-4]